MFKSNYERKMRYSIRKFSVGVASVAVASLFMGSVAHASELVKDDSVKTTEVAAKPYPSMAQTDQGNNSSSSELETTKMEIPTTDIKKAVEPVEKTAITASQNDEKRKSTEKVTAEKTKETDSSKSNDNKAKVEKLKNRLKNQINQSQLSENEKKNWLASIDNEEDTDNLQTLEYEFKEFIQKKQEQTSKQSDTKVDLGNIDKELNYQKRQVEKMAEQKGITNEDKDSMLKKIEDIRKQAQQADKKEDAEVKVREELGKLFSSTKAGLDQEIQEHVKKETSSEENTQKVDEHYANSLQNLAQKSLEELDKATTNKQAKQIKNQFLENAQKLKEIQPLIKETNVKLYKAMSESLKHVEQELKHNSEANLGDLVAKSKEIVREYEGKLNQSKNLPELKQLEEEAHSRLKHVVEDFRKKFKTSEEGTPKKRVKRDLAANENNQQKIELTVSPANITVYEGEDVKFTVTAKSDSKIKLNFLDLLTKYNPSVVGTRIIHNYKNDVENHKIVEITIKNLKPNESQTVTLKAQDDSGNVVEKTLTITVQKKEEKQVPKAPEQKDSKAEEKIPQEPKSNDKNQLQELIKSAQQELEKLEKAIKDLMEQPEIPSNPEYGIQKSIWESQKEPIQEAITSFKNIIGDSSSQYYTEHYFNKYKSDFMNYQLHAQMEMLTRKVVQFMNKYPDNAEIKKIFETDMKRTKEDNYGSLENDALKGYFEQYFLTPFNKIKQIVDDLDKKVEQDQPAPIPENSEMDQDKEKAKIAVSKYMSKVLDGVRQHLQKENHSKIVDLFKELEAIKQQTIFDIDNAKTEVEIDNLVHDAFSKMDATVAKFQKGLEKNTPETPDTPQAPEAPQAPDTPKSPDVPKLPDGLNKVGQAVFTSTDGNTKVTVVFDKPTDADKLHLKEVTTKELADKIARKTGGGTVRVFDLSLSKGGKETHVNGERTVRLALGQTGSDVHVYHVKENGDLERIPSKVENGQVVFKTNHFSLFAIKTLSKNQNVTTPKQTKPSIQDSQTQIGESQTGKFQNKEVNHKPLATENETVAKGNPTSATKKKLPSTGVASNLVLEILGLLGLIGTSFIAMKRRK
ncbi:IgA Fc-binding protein BAC [Streptococcus anginosus]|uniref:IgA Fc-binding protein BAC n=4 Tax=Streptococcus TaxID=1301 RepID=A0A412PM99_STRAP|nr:MULTISPECIES: IgA Fc-binding protein BAC [Streptococcus]ETI85291.1 MAG: Fc receptor [Streptococcus anginosus DORA_7]KAA9246685.1 YSIRK-type signal peptide-containing protein [Streptococcus anginosus]KAA9252617.1 YSIRK-type signal peptide-containing protein [Streptococcus anginosus]KAA9258595.1 YSIRK-type signal peptide-containing protein [Streptococcus anginosus]KAA9262748.1 YSIRK-type signal peptide-containing protein [Streptococcus anginosus]